MTDDNAKADSLEIKKLTKEEKREVFLYKVVVPIVAAVLGAVISTIVLIWLRSTNVDNAQLQDVILLIKDPDLNAAQKLQALNIYKEITDRPWSILRSVVTYLGAFLFGIIGALTAGGFFQRKS